MEADKYLQSIGLDNVIDEEFFNDDDKSWYKVQDIMESYHQAMVIKLSNINKQQFNEDLRNKFFKECTDIEDKGYGATVLRKVNLTPHDLFEWFKKNVK